jgi:hypothetical protein
MHSFSLAHAIYTILMQVYSKEGNHAPNFHEKLLAVGGRYDWLMEQACDKAYVSCMRRMIYA